MPDLWPRGKCQVYEQFAHDSKKNSPYDRNKTFHRWIRAYHAPAAAGQNALLGFYRGGGVWRRTANMDHAQHLGAVGSPTKGACRCKEPKLLPGGFLSLGPFAVEWGASSILPT